MHIDTQICVGYGVCVGLRPDVFGLDDEDKAHLLTEYLTAVDRRDLEDAVRECPVQALRLEG